MKKFEKKIKTQLDSLTPDVKDKVKANISVFVTKKEKNRVKFVAPLMVVAVLLIVIITPILIIKPDTANNNVVNNYTLVLSVNPSVELCYDKNNNVTSARGLNKDGIMLLYRNNIVGKNINDATNDIIRLIEQFGYLDNNHNVKISIKNDNGQFDDKQYSLMKQTIEKQLISLGITDKTLSQLTDDEFEILEDDIEENAEKYFNEFKQEIKDCLEESLVYINNLKDMMFSYIKSIYPAITDEKDFDTIEDFLDNDNIVANQDIIDKIIEYGILYDDDIEDIDFNNFTEKKLFGVYEDLFDKLRENEVALLDVINDRVPDDIDEIIEIIIKKQI